MAVSKRIRTDLALETTERFKEENTEIRGICQKNSHDEIPPWSERKICGQTQIAYLNAKW